MNRLINEDGFTLVETLIVLLVSSVLILMPTLSIGQLMEEMEINFFFRELTSNLTLMQNQSIMGGHGTKVSFYGTKQKDHILFVVNSGHPLNREMVLDRPYYRLAENKPIEFRFKGGTGNITSSNTVKFSSTQGQYKLTYLLGSGRFDIKKEIKK